MVFMILLFSFGLMEQVLLLNITYEPLKIIGWKKAITLLTLGKVEVIEEYGREIHSVTFTIKLPSVVRLLQMVRRPKALSGSRVKTSMPGTVTIANIAVTSSLLKSSLMIMSSRSREAERPSGKISSPAA